MRTWRASVSRQSAWRQTRWPGGARRLCSNRASAHVELTNRVPGNRRRFMAASGTAP
jgi:hypothetical protein